MIENILRKIILWAGFQAKWNSFVNSELCRYRAKSIILRKKNIDNLLVQVEDRYIIFTVPKKIIKQLHDAFPDSRNGFRRIS